MASDPFFDAVKTRRSIYALTNASPIPDSRIQEIVSLTITHVPSAFNIQSARAVIFLGEQHRRFWTMAGGHMRKALGEEVWKTFEKKVNGFIEGYGSVLFFEDDAKLDVLRTKNPIIRPLIGEWGSHSSGMHQFAVWTAFAAEGLGCNLQHYNFIPAVSEHVKKMWYLPESWVLHAQLVFGTPAAPAGQRTYLPVEERTKVFS